ncbi:hypothetical protein N6H13_19765 [Paenibacillus sp. CC-CFT742]|nr:hypothetical protein [Paenibacillus sp. CC-CFT742]WJH27494.1 hypothetical protein N6H13_19765 [Paenibacillus sp. CC-CFT742]
MDIFINASPDDLLKQLLTIYTLDSSEEANLLMQALYFLRSPLFVPLSKYISQNISTELKAWIAQMEGDLILSKQLWLNCSKITSGSQRDLLCTAIITKDPLFFKHFDNEFNLRTKDKLLFIKIIKRESIIDAEFSQDFKKYFENLCYDIIMQRQYEVVEYLMKKLHVPMLRFELAKMLFKFHFDELSLECIIEPQKPTEKNQVYLLTGDILKSLRMYGDAYHYYSQIRSPENEFELMYKIYDLATKAGDFSAQKSYVKLMSTIIPKSEWANRYIDTVLQGEK